MNEDDSGDFPHMLVPNYFQTYLNQALKLNNLLPINIFPERILYLTLEGFGTTTFTVQDATLHNIMSICVHHIKLIKKLYGKKNLFTDPEFRFTPEGKFTLKIGIMSKEEYKLRFPKKKAKNGK